MGLKVCLHLQLQIWETEILIFNNHHNIKNPKNPKANKNYKDVWSSTKFRPNIKNSVYMRKDKCPTVRWALSRRSRVWSSHFVDSPSVSHSGKLLSGKTTRHNSHDSVCPTNAFHLPRDNKSKAIQVPVKHQIHAVAVHLEEQTKCDGGLH